MKGGVYMNMTDKDRINQFMDFMKLPDGTPIVSVGLMDYLVTSGFFMKPAAIKHHGNYTGGLFDHSLNVASILVKMTNDLGIKWSRPESPYLVGMLHDVCKLDDYIDKNASDVVVMGTGSPISKNPEWVYNDSPMFKGHGDKSVMMLATIMSLTEEEMLCIRFHMGAYVTDEWSNYDAAIRKYETVLWTHTADMYASKVLNT